MAYIILFDCLKHLIVYFYLITLKQTNKKALEMCSFKLYIIFVIEWSWLNITNLDFLLFIN